MIPDDKVRTVSSKGVMDEASFGISIADSAHIMTILRDTLYSDKVLAVLREYSANAWDSHRMSGKGDLPIKVHIPTAVEPTLSIRDFGSGLSKDDVFNVYTQYGASTKRDSELAVGMLGIGSKSGFAYSDMFTVTSWFGGTKSIYSAMLDASDKGIISLIGEELCGDETGIKIEIPILDKDIEEFKRKAASLYTYFEPRPDINIDLDPPKQCIGKFKSGVLHSRSEYSYGEGAFTAVMGCVPYRLDLNQLDGWEDGVPAYMRSLSGLLHFDIGEVHVNASREELKYSDKTKKAIVEKLNTLVDDYVTVTVKAINDANVSQWEKRILCQEIKAFQQILGDNMKLYTETSVKMSDKIPTTVVGKDAAGNEITEALFWLGGLRRVHHDTIYVNRNTRLIIKDDGRSLKGFKLASNDVLVYRNRAHNLKTVEKALNKLLVDTDTVGLPITRTSALVWSPPFGTKARTGNVKHGQKLFKFNPQMTSTYSYTRRTHKLRAPSDHWDSITHVPSDKDVYVEIDNFRPSYDLNEKYKQDKAMFNRFGIIMPDVIGYKITVKDPRKTRLGTEYREWQKKTALEVCALPSFKPMVEIYDWHKVIETYYGSRNKIISVVDLTAALGVDHIVTEFFRTRDMFMQLPNPDSTTVGAIRDLLGGKLPEEMMPASKKIREIYKLYPVLSCETVSLEKIKDNFNVWMEYIKMVDVITLACQGS